MNWIKTIKNATKVLYRTKEGKDIKWKSIEPREIKGMKFLYYDEGGKFMRLKLSCWNRFFKRNLIKKLYTTASVLFKLDGVDVHISNDDRDSIEQYHRTIKKLGGKRADDMTFIKYGDIYCLLTYYSSKNEVIVYDLLNTGTTNN